MSGYPDGCTQRTHDEAFGELGPSPGELAAEADAQNDEEREAPQGTPQNVDDDYGEDFGFDRDLVENVFKDDSKEARSSMKLSWYVDEPRTTYLDLRGVPDYDSGKETVKLAAQMTLRLNNGKITVLDVWEDLFPLVSTELPKNPNFPVDQKTGML